MRTETAVAIGIWLALVGFQVCAAAVRMVPAPGVRAVSVPRDETAFLTPEIRPGVWVGQSFKALIDGLDGVTISIPTDAPAGGHLVLRLWQLGPNRPEKLVREEVISAEQAVRQGSYTFRFHPIERSFGHLYRLEVGTLPEDPAIGVPLVAVGGRHLQEGTMWVNGESGYSDLVFRTSPDAPPAETALRRLERILDDPSHRGPGGVTLAFLFIAFEAALLYLLVTLSSRRLRGGEVTTG